MPRLASSTADSRPRSTCCCGAWSLYRFATFVIAHSTTAHSAVYVSIKRTLRETFLRAGSRPHPAGGDKGCRLGASGMFAEDMYRPPYVLWVLGNVLAAATLLKNFLRLPTRSPPAAPRKCNAMTGSFQHASRRFGTAMQLGSAFATEVTAHCPATPGDQR